MTVVLREEPILPLQKFMLPRRVLAVIVLGTLFLLVSTSVVVSFLYFHAHHGFGLTLANVVPVPAAVIDGSVVWYRQVAVTANELESEAGLSPTEAMQRALLLEAHERITERLASDLGVARSKDRLAFMTALEAAVLASDVHQADARAKVERLVVKMDQGLPFYDMAVQYSEGPSAETGGDLGFVDPETLPEDLRTAAKALAPGEVSDVVATEKSFWLVKREEMQESDEGGRLMWLRVIEVKKDLLGAVVDREFAGAEIRQLMR